MNPLFAIIGSGRTDIRHTEQKACPGKLFASGDRVPEKAVTLTQKYEAGADYPIEYLLQPETDRLKTSLPYLNEKKRYKEIALTADKLQFAGIADGLMKVMILQKIYSQNHA